ncbi:MAG: Ig-like domain-containing protein [Bacteroidetes bacterium]|nr:Ig-like domain-containing protein [Bacteroidota bacterium]
MRMVEREGYKGNTGLLSRYLLIVFMVGVLAFPGGWGCANIIPPGGGPIDSLPPQPVAALPKDSALRVDLLQSKFTLQFDEFIELKNATEQVIISPYPAKNPLIESKLKTLSVKFKDTLLPNTTYTIDFGNAVADINEGNIQKNFTYVFSTGNHIDSNHLSGRVLTAETGKVDSTLWAVLYSKQEDSTISKENPRYVARVNGKGYFRFDRLPPGQFYLYALKDADGNKRYNQPIESIAFLNQPLLLPADSLSPILYAFATEKEKKPVKPKTADKTKDDKLSYQSNLTGGNFDLLDTLTLTFPRKITNVNRELIRMTEDSIEKNKNFELVYDSLESRLKLITAFKPGTSCKLYLNKGFAADSAGRITAKNDTLRFRVKEEKEYGSLRIRFNNLNFSNKPVLLFYQNESIRHRVALNKNEFYARLFRPGNYQLALLYDTNGNETWDAGDFFANPKKQPEIVHAIEKECSVKENWDNELEINLFTPTP